MDLVGGDDQLREEMMQTLQASMTNVNSSHARITYDNFLLLMKGQTSTEPDQPEPSAPAPGSGRTLPSIGSSKSAGLGSVPENEVANPALDDDNFLGDADDDDDVDEFEGDEAKFGADSRRAVSLIEHDKSATFADASAPKKTALVVNRQLYRAHRQMRTSVLEASRRFEEFQVRRARETLIAQKEAEANHSIMKFGRAGLVMRHGLKVRVSSEEIQKLLEEYRAAQQALVEKADRRAGRAGRAHRKKSTMSDMSGLLAGAMGDEKPNPLRLSDISAMMVGMEGDDASRKITSESLKIPSAP